MRARTLITKTAAVVAAIAFCGLCVAGGGGPENHPLPIHMHGTLTVTYLTDDSGTPTGFFTFVDVGECSYLGRYLNTGGGPVLDEDGNLLHLASGTTIAANGEKSYWYIDADAPTVVVFNGGTGRFEGDSGSFEMHFTSGPTTNPDGSVTQTYTGTGTITFKK